MFPVILLRRSWLIAAPLWLLVGAVLLWAAFQWEWWSWLRSVVIVVVAAVVLISIGTFVGGLAVLTRDGFWLPGQGRGRWSDVIDRDEYELTMRVSDLDGSPGEVSFERVERWPATARWLDALVPKDLPRLGEAEPHPEFVRDLDEWTDRLLARLRERCQPPECRRRWVLPDQQDGHRVVLSFAPTAAGSRVELSITGSEELPEISVDGCFAVEELSGVELDDFGDPDAIARAAVERTAAVLTAVFQDAPRASIASWQIVDADGETVQFYPDKLMK
ncbi:MAG: hypothetical protein QM582_01785 [Micropruina sp.]|uniref:hypothetical protein n=1 Tax=Micropruina sp. TaxID=2737536 RepID=UPI0039E2FAB5